MGPRWETTWKFCTRINRNEDIGGLRREPGGMQGISGERPRSLLMRHSGAVRRETGMAHTRRCAESYPRGEKIVETMDGVAHEVGRWDMLIAHPPCTYLSNAGARHLWKNHQLQADRVTLGIKGRDLFMRFWWSDIQRICIENPIPSRVFGMPERTQIIEPWQYGHPYKKKTCLWLKGLPKLEPTNIVDPIATWCPSGSYSGKHGEEHRGMFTKDRAKNRSKTFPGIARAMAEQWG